MSGDLTIQQGQDDLLRAQDRSRSLKPPCDVPGYEMERFLGAGAFGEVWVAVEKNTNRRVAIKFFSHARGDWSQLNREVERLAFLSADRYVVQLLEVGWNATPPYYVMEYLEHGSLEDRLQEGPLPAAEAIAMFREIAQALVHAHGKGVLHCDLKPANVLLDEDASPRLADFGQSRLSHEQTPALGTLFYMAPEQADLDAVPDARWDVYSLGAVMYRMLTGAPPFRSAEAAKSLEGYAKLDDRLKAYREMIRKAPTPADHRKAAGVDRGLAEIVDRCLSPSESRRYPNAQAVVDAIHRWNQRTASRPLLLLGAFVPALLLGATATIGWIAFGMVIGRTEQALVERSLEANRFAARFVAETAARDIDQRWRILETEAMRLVPLLEAAGNKRVDSQERKALQARLDDLRERHQEATPATSWFLADFEGYQLARSPFGDTVNRYWAFRDYFHGQGRDLPPGTRGAAPIKRPHRSMVYESGGTGNRTVAFSVPIRKDDREDGPVLGVLAMTVEVGDFGELRSSASENLPQIAVLADTRPQANGSVGLILQHPVLADRMAARQGQEKVKLPDSRLGSDILEMAAQVLEERRKHGSPGGGSKSGGVSNLVAAYADPLAKEDARYEGRWLAAVEPVMVEGREVVEDTGWVTIVQERYDTATGPVQRLKERLFLMGTIFFGGVVIFLTAAWVFLFRVINASSRKSIWKRLRSRGGASESAGSYGSVGNTGTGQGTAGTAGSGP